MTKPHIAINGFGRIGRMVVRCNLEGNPERNFEKEALEIVAINDLSPPKTLAHLLKWDSSYGKIGAEIAYDEKNIIINGKKIPVFAERDPANLPWKNLGIDVVVECTGIFTDRDGASKHLAAGARKVLISAPAKSPDITLVWGVNETLYDRAKHNIISMASCTTGSLAPLCKVLLENFGIEHGLMTTIHSYTNDQGILDQSHKDLRRARAAAISLVPTTTGAAKAIGEVLPALAGKMNGVAVRVPTPTVSLTDLTCVLTKKADPHAVNSALKKAAAGYLKGILEVSEEPLVSMDFKKNPHSAIIDAELTESINSLVKVFAWYDNEWGYSMRLTEMAKYVA